MYVCIYMCIYVYIYIYIYTHTQNNMILMCAVFKNKINELDLPNFEYASIIQKIFCLYWANEDKLSALKMTNFVSAHEVVTTS